VVEGQGAREAVATGGDGRLSAVGSTRPGQDSSEGEAPVPPQNTRGTVCAFVTRHVGKPFICFVGCATVRSVGERLSGAVVAGFNNKKF